LKRINNEQILDTIYDLADSLGLRIDEFLERVEEEFGEQPIDLNGLSENIIYELNQARDTKKQQRRLAREQKNKEEINADIKRFRAIFPEVPADDIPDSVWEDVQNGASLAHAYALYLIESEQDSARAERINRKNGESGAVAGSDGSLEPVFTKEQVEKMTGRDVKKNYKNILKAMKNWKL